MDFSFDAVIDGPLDKVLVMLRDRLVELVPYLETVDAIRETRREVDGPVTRISNAWTGTSKGLPVFAKPFATKAMLSWQDHADWNVAEGAIDWRFEPDRMKKLYVCGGRNFITDLGDNRTKLQINGHLVIDPKRFPRVARRLIPRLERWIIAKIEPSLAQVPTAVQAFFEQERHATPDATA